MRVALITTVAGRERHLTRQLEAVRSADPGPDDHVVVAMRAPRTVAALCPPEVDVLTFEHAGELPLAAARNLGARTALGRGADLLVFLDVDCLPAPGLLGRYAGAAREAGDALLCGPVAYLPGGEGPAAPHRARPLPGEDTLLRGGDHRLFWSLSFATTASTWHRVGGFCERYVGYGGEDTDFGQLARRAGVDLCWVGGAWSYHQHHPTSSPPFEHHDAILRNARLFHRRWGWWPMEGWLRAFVDAEASDPGTSSYGVRARATQPMPDTSGPTPLSPSLYEPDRGSSRLKRVVSHSLSTKAQGHGSRLMPDRLKAKLHRGMAEPGSADDDS